jgi:hypothetical protein
MAELNDRIVIVNKLSSIVLKDIIKTFKLAPVTKVKKLSDRAKLVVESDKVTLEYLAEQLVKSDELREEMKRTRKAKKQHEIELSLNALKHFSVGDRVVWMVKDKNTLESECPLFGLIQSVKQESGTVVVRCVESVPERVVVDCDTVDDKRKYTLFKFVPDWNTKLESKKTIQCRLLRQYDEDDDYMVRFLDDDSSSDDDDDDDGVVDQVKIST